MLTAFALHFFLFLDNDKLLLGLSLSALSVMLHASVVLHDENNVLNICLS